MFRTFELQFYGHAEKSSGKNEYKDFYKKTTIPVQYVLKENKQSKLTLKLGSELLGLWNLCTVMLRYLSNRNHMMAKDTY